jgi:hypothetical protein
VKAELLSFEHLVEAVEGGGLVAFGERGVVEDGVDEIFDAAVEGEDGLADVEEFGGTFTDDVDAEQMLGIGIEEKFEAAGSVSPDLPASNLAEVGHANFVGNAFVGQLFFGFTDEGNFGNGVDAVGIVGAVGVDGHAKGVGGSDAALFHGDGAEAGETNDVANGENVRLLRAVLIVYMDASAVVSVEAGGGEIEIIDIAVTADGVKERFAGDFLFGFEIGNDQMIGSFFDAFDFLIKAKSDAAVAEVIAKGFDHFGIGEFQEARAFFDQGDTNPESGEHANVLNANDAATDDDHGLGNLGDAENLVAINDGGAIERDERRFGGLGTGGDDDVVSFEFGLAARAFDLNAMRIEEAGGAGDDVDAVAGELSLDDIDFSFDDIKGAEGKIGHADVFLHAVIGAIDALVLVARKMEDSFADGFAGDGAGVDGDATDDFEAFDERGAFAELGGLNGRALAGRAGANDDEVVRFHERGESITPLGERNVGEQGTVNRLQSTVSEGRIWSFCLDRRRSWRHI